MCIKNRLSDCNMKTNPGKYLILLMLAGIFTGCEKDFFCGEDKNKGIIIESINPGYCIDNFTDSTFVILSEVQLDSLYEYENCSDAERPEINFNEQTLLGYYVDGGGCDIQFIREVITDESGQRYIYTVKVKACGWCAKLGYSMNWVLVPKLPENWTVEFRTQ